MELRVRLFTDGVASDLDFLLVGGPLDTDYSAAMVFAAIGHVAASWARIEKHIDILLIQINKATHSSELLDLYDPKHPKPFEDKRKLLKKYFNQHPALSPYTETIRSIASELRTTACERNKYAHSALEAYDAEEKKATFKSIEFKGNDTYSIITTVQPLGGIFDLMRRINDLNRRLGLISESIFTTDALERLGKP